MSGVSLPVNMVTYFSAAALFKHSNVNDTTCGKYVQYPPASYNERRACENT